MQMRGNSGSLPSEEPQNDYLGVYEACKGLSPQADTQFIVLPSFHIYFPGVCLCFGNLS